MRACRFVKQHHLATHGCWQEGPSHGEVQQRATGRWQLSNIFGEFDHYLEVTQGSPRTGAVIVIYIIHLYKAYWEKNVSLGIACK